MELDDLKTAWQSLDRRLEQVYASELRTLRQQHLGKVRRHVRLLTAGRIIQLLAGVALTLFMGDFWISHLDQPHLLICGVLLHVYGIMLIISSAREFYLINNLHYDSPVVLIQRKLAELRRWHLTEAYVFGVTGCFIWVPMVLVAFQLLFWCRCLFECARRGVGLPCQRSGASSWWLGYSLLVGPFSSSGDCSTHHQSPGRQDGSPRRISCRRNCSLRAGHLNVMRCWR